MTMVSVKACAAAAGVFVAALAASPAPDPVRLTVHEWGTFTSIAGENGRAVPWRPLSGPPELPSFVVGSRVQRKSDLTATVRMETPVLYFYAPQETVVDVSVRFREGLFTEYFPRAYTTPDTIRWSNVRIQPGATPSFPMEAGKNHYYAARQTDAAPLAVGPDRERFLFYRGVGGFELPLTASVRPDQTVAAGNIGGDVIPAVVLFENRAGRVGWRLHRNLKASAQLAPPQLDGSVAALRVELERVLVEQGLYDREAKAMVETWSDTWFEEGTRLFYIVPIRLVDAILPLDIKPAPESVARVFVGRLELVTAASLTDLESALRRNDAARLARFGRFLQPIADRFLAGPLSAADRARFERLLLNVGVVATSRH